MDPESSWDSIESLMTQPMVRSFEVEFLVAQERPGVNYSEPDAPHGTRAKYACPAGEKRPFETILNKCKEVLLQAGQPATVRHDANHCNDTIFQNNSHAGPSCSPSSNRWFVQAAPDVLPRQGRPLEYEWVGVRLRSPMLPEAALHDCEPPGTAVLAVLRSAVRIYVGSTCRHAARIRPRDRPMDLTAAKKLAALTATLERPLLARLGPQSNRALLTTRIARLVGPPRGVQSNMSEDPELARLTNEHVPAMRDREMQERLQAIWGVTTMSALAWFVARPGDREAAFAVEAEEGGPTAVFRYGLWHPHRGLDTSGLWVRLLLCVGRAAQLDDVLYKELMRNIDETVDSFPWGISGRPLWRMEMEHIGFQDSTLWGPILGEYGPGGVLSPEWIDRHPALEGFQM